MDARLSGKKVFIVEDEQLILLLLEDMLAELGAVVVAQADNLADGLELAQSREFDVAILDLNIGGVKVYPVADVLVRRNKPFIFASGYGGTGIPDHLSSHPVITKPYQLEELAVPLLAAVAGPSS